MKRCVLLVLLSFVLGLIVSGCSSPNTANIYHAPDSEAGRQIADLDAAGKKFQNSQANAVRLFKDVPFQFSYAFKMTTLKEEAFFDTQIQVEFAEAVAKGDANGMQKLIANGADVNYLGRNGVKPLFWAMVKQNIEGFRFLLNNGADPNATVDTMVPPHDSALTLAADMDDSGYLEELLKRGVNPNSIVGKSDETAIFRASFYGKTNNVTVLLKYGADINAKNAAEQTPMHKSINGCAYVTALFLYRAGANPLIKDKWGYDCVDDLKKSNFAMTLADHKAYPQLVEELRKHGQMD